jgi:hypothetical protein
MQPKLVARYLGVRSASSTYPQRPEPSRGDKTATQGANLRVEALGALSARIRPQPSTRGIAPRATRSSTRDGSGS